jgi:hypothetical protein
VTKRRIALLVTGAIAVLAMTGLVLSSLGSHRVVVTGHLKPEDPLQIQRAVSRYRWVMVRETLMEHDFKFLFSAHFVELAVGQIRELGSEDDRTINGFGWSLTNAYLSWRAYAILAAPRFERSFRYRLTRATNGWAVSPPVTIQ